MKIYLTRHGQTDWNKQHLMQGRSDLPLNETGRMQAGEIRRKLEGISFDAVYASCLKRAVITASLISGYPEEEGRRDARINEVDFGACEGKRYGQMGLPATLYWMFPELFPAPFGMEDVDSMRKRSASVLQDLMKRKEESVLVVCHGGIIRPLRGYLEGKKSGLVWRPRPRNCEVFVYETEGETVELVEDLR